MASKVSWLNVKRQKLRVDEPALKVTLNIACSEKTDASSMSNVTLAQGCENIERKFNP